jgi:DNA-binding transcriptional LysR family regulator
MLVEGLHVMAAVADARSFGRAGEMLDMSQSGVSRSVARLEERLGVRLFERTTRAVRFTDEGRRFHAQVMPLLQELEEAVENAHGGARSIRGRLRVNVDPFFSRLILGPQLGGFLERHPDLTVELRTRDDLGDMVAEGFDLAVRFGHPPASTLVARKLLDLRVITVATSGYVKRRGLPREPQELESGRHRCILFRDSVTGQPFPWEFHKGRRKIVIAPHGALTVNDAATLESTCAAGYGIAQIFELAQDPLVADRKVVHLFPDWSDEKFPLFAYYPSRRHLPVKTRAMLEFIAGLVR